MGVTIVSPVATHGALNWDAQNDANWVAIRDAVNLPALAPSGAGWNGGSDLSAMNASGMYYGSALTNAPGGSAGGFFVWFIRRDSQNGAQVAISLTGVMYFRSQSGGAWTAWKTVTAT